MRDIGGGALVRIKLRDPFCGVCSGKLRPHPIQHRSPLRFACGNMVQRGDNFAGVIASDDLINDFADAGERICGSYGKRLRHRASLHFAFCSLRLTRGDSGCNACV